MAKLKIVNDRNFKGIHVWKDGTIHLDTEIWDITQGISEIIHIYTKEVKK